MTWKTEWSGGFPIAFDSAKGNVITDVDGLRYIDFALGDTGAMAGHSPNLEPGRTSAADIDRHSKVFTDAVTELVK